MTINWQEVVSNIGMAVGGGTSIVFAVAWLTRALISDRMARDAEAFKARLKADGDAEIERLKNALQMTAVEHQVRFSKLHEQRADVISELYKLLTDAHWGAQAFVFRDVRNQDEHARAIDKITELYRFIQMNRLYLPSSVCQLLDNFESKLRHSVVFVGVYWRVEFPTPKTTEEQNKVLMDACAALESELPALRGELEKEFRSLLGVTV